MSKANQPSDQTTNEDADTDSLANAASNANIGETTVDNEAVRAELGETSVAANERASSKKSSTASEAS